MLTARTTRIGTLVVLTFFAVGAWGFAFFRNSSVAAQSLGGPLGRPRLEVCVQNMDGTVVEPEVMDKITTAFKEVKKHRDFEAAGLNAGGGPKLKAGCPSGPTLKENKARKVTKPSPEFTFIFIASEEDLKGVLFKYYPRVKSQETMCKEDSCTEVTKALYLTPQEIGDPAKLIPALTFGVGLMPTEPPQSQYRDGVTSDPQAPGR